MSWVPKFEIGFWNAWMLCLFVLIHPYIMILVDRVVGAGDIYRKMGGSEEEAASKRTIPIPTALLIVLFILSIITPLRLGTVWLYVGLAIYLSGVVLFISSLITAAKTPFGHIFSTGLYRYSRHPLYLSFMIIFLGTSVAAASWLFLLLSLGWMAFPLSQVTAEERGCLDTFGEEYQAYMERTPKWLGFPHKG